MADELSLSPDEIASLIVRVRALMAREESAAPESDGSPSDDDSTALLRETEDDLSRDSLIDDIEALNTDKQAELVALMWLGRGDGEPDEWESLYETAYERHETPTAEYLLGHPLLAEYWAGGLDALGLGSVTMDYRGR